MNNSLNNIQKYSNKGYEIQSKIINNDLLVIGNGFDLLLGLQSSFTSFLDKYSKLDNSLHYFLHNSFNKLSSVIGNREYKGYIIDPLILIKYLDGIYISPLKNGSSTEIDINELDLTKKKDKKYMGKIIHIFLVSINKIQSDNRHNINFWILFLLLHKDEKISTWSDVEQNIYKFFTGDNSPYLQFIYCVAKMSHIRVPKIYNKCKLTNFNNKLTFNTLFMSFIFMNGNGYHLKRSLKFKDVFDITKIKSFKKLYLKCFTFFKKQLSEFEMELNNYLLKCVMDYDKLFGKSYAYMSNKLLKCLTLKDHFSLLNFNYTDPISMLKGSNRHKLTLLINNKRNIHGKLIASPFLESNKLKKDSNAYMTRDSPIIGISDRNININDNRYSFTKNYRIMRLSCNYYSNILNNNNYIKFFGHSFDPADYSYLFNIFDHYKINDENNIKWMFYYVPYGEQNDDDGARHQIKKVNTLIYNYYLNKYGDNRANYHKASISAKKLIYTLSFEGRLIITNLYDVIRKDPKLKSQFEVINNVKKLLLKMDEVKEFLHNRTNSVRLSDLQRNVFLIIQSLKRNNSINPSQDIFYYRYFNGPSLMQKYTKFDGYINFLRGKKKSKNVLLNILKIFNKMFMN